ncbi:TorF family putative porin [Novosphingobium arvoryzae]|uniref:TIGR02001 family outer membrane protein n=1 Tax=Novosphingobium arvoryzae TaxID=1256514 RepID=A0A918RD61_9SPHN|nr:TorF family putative porin [Novosphingobium arvoryzae]GGZ92729.1 TIGR02001 family outer membrane protein [Novosphingobium arvoryzae]
MLTSVRGLFAATLLAGCALAATPALADETDPPSDVTVTGSVALVTDYRFRGLSLSGGDFAVQGSVNVNHSSGFYAGAWASSLEDSPVYGNAELDVYAGWTGEIASGVTADVGLLYYVYPNGNVGDANVFEPYASISGSLGPATAKVGVAYAWKQDSLGGDDNLYLYTDWSLAVPETPLSVSAHLGYTDGALSPKLLTGVSTSGGLDYSVGAAYQITPALSLGVSYVGVEGASIDGFSNDAVVATLKASF